MSWPQTGATQYHAQFELPDKGAIKELIVCNDWYLEPFDLLNGLPLDYYQQSPEVLIIISMMYIMYSIFVILAML